MEQMDCFTKMEVMYHGAGMELFSLVQIGHPMGVAEGCKGKRGKKKKRKGKKKSPCSLVAVVSVVLKRQGDLLD